MSEPNATSRLQVTPRTVDLGREDEFVTWQEWCARTMSHMREIVPQEHHPRLAFRITFTDGREIAARQVLTHVVRERCSLEPSRWNDAEAICDVITGYIFLGAGEDLNFTALAVPPTMIASVETVLVPLVELEEKEQQTPFGFYKREGVEVPTKQREIEESFEGE